MSRVGKAPVVVPPGVEVKIDGSTITAKGKKGNLSFSWSRDVDVVLDGNEIIVRSMNEARITRAMWGTTRARIANLVIGVSEGYEKRLEMQGVGYRAQMKGRDLTMQLGFSHDVVVPTPEGLEIVCESPTIIIVRGADKQRVGQTAAEIREWRPPEPYKGKGIRYADEYILRKEGKKK